MKTDQELLELAAKSLGGSDIIWTDIDGNRYTGDPERSWDPLNDDADAFRLANKLHLCICHTLGGMPRAHGTAMVGISMWEGGMPIAAEKYEGHSDADRATRRAIVRAAAALAEQP